jgi:branched-subunit amino acid aminotransferase/4-amino-4-deoxychorismate lyase
MARLRQSAQAVGAEDSVIMDTDGYVVEGAYSAMVWWYGDALCTPGDDQTRVASVTERTVVTLAKALGIEVLQDHATPRELDGHEVWVLNALHGIRIATFWVDGPTLAQEPGRLTEWRRRIDALARPLP